MTKNLDKLGGPGKVEAKDEPDGKTPDGGFSLAERVQGGKELLAQFQKQRESASATSQKKRKPKAKPPLVDSGTPSTGASVSPQRGPAVRRRGGSGGDSGKTNAHDAEIQKYFDKEESSVAKTYGADGKRLRRQENGPTDDRGVARPLTADEVNGGRATLPPIRERGVSAADVVVTPKTAEPTVVFDEQAVLDYHQEDKGPLAPDAAPSVASPDSPDRTAPTPDAPRAVEIGPESVALPGEGEHLSYYTDEGKLVEVVLTEDGKYKMYDPADESDASILKDAESMRNTLFYGRFGYAGKRDSAVNATLSQKNGTTGSDRNGASAEEYSGEQLVELVNKDPKPVNLADAGDVSREAPEKPLEGEFVPADAKLPSGIKDINQAPEKAEAAKSSEIVDAEVLPPAAENPKERLEKAEADLAAMRTRYAEAYYKEHKTKNRLTQVFGRFFNRDAFSADDEKVDYEAALARYQDARLAVMKGELSGGDYKESAAQLLKFMTLEGRVTLYDRLQEVRKENMGWFDKGEQMFRKFGEWYAKQPLKRRLLVGAGLGAVGVASAYFAGGAATIGSVLILAKRALASAGAYASSNAMMKGAQERRALKQNEKEELKSQREFEKETDPLKRFERLEALLTEKREKANRDFEARRYGDVRRKALAAGVAGAVLGSGELFKAAGWAAGEAGDAIKAAPWWPKISGLFADAQQFAGDTFQRAGDVAGKVADQAKRLVNGLSPDAADQARQFAGDARKLGGEAMYPSGAIEVKPGSTVWGLLKEQLSDSSSFAGMDAGRQDYAIDLLKDRLAAMSAEDLKNGGISSGKLDLLRAGDKVDFGKLFGSTGVWQEAIDKAGGIPNAVADQVVANRSGSGVGAAIAESIVSPEAGGSGLKVNPATIEPKFEAIAPTPEAVSAAPALDDYRAWLKANPEAFGKFSAKGGDYLMGIFRTDGVEGNVLYDFSFHGNVFGRVEVAAVLNDMRKLSGNPFANYDRSINPLHFSQMENLAQFVRLSGEAFGDLGKLKPGESIFEYTRRMAALSVRTGKRIGVFN